MHPPRRLSTLAILYQILQRYRLEHGLSPDLLDDFTLETVDEILTQLPAGVKLMGLSPAQRLEGLSADEVLAGLTPEIREALARRLQGNRPTPSPG